MSHIYFSNKEIQVDWHQLAYDQNTIVKLDLGSETPAPKPATLAMLGCGMLGLAPALSGAKPSAANELTGPEIMGAGS